MACKKSRFISLINLLLRVAVVLLILGILPSTSRAEDSASRAIRKPAIVEASDAPTSQPQSSPPTIGGMSIDFGRVVAATAIVIGLILLMRLAAKKFLGIGTNAPNDVVRVLSRTLISPRQQVVMLHVGRRIIIACDSGGQVTTLSTITEADEVAELLARTSGKSPSAAFNQSLEEEQSLYDASGQISDPKLAADGIPGDAPDPVANLRGEIGSLIDRVRALSGSTSSSSRGER
jgi:flagellar biogenesis protein FliO